jgi:hypothetical protein
MISKCFSWVILLVLAGCWAPAPPQKSVVIQEYDFSEELFRKLWKQQMFVVTGIFTKYTAPYPGAITQSVDCPEEYHPKLVHFNDDRMTGDGYILFANARKAIGSCLEKDKVFRVFTGVIYCKPTSKLYEYKEYLPPTLSAESVQAKIEEIDCATLGR